MSRPRPEPPATAGYVVGAAAFTGLALPRCARCYTLEAARNAGWGLIS